MGKDGLFPMRELRLFIVEKIRLREDFISVHKSSDWKVQRGQSGTFHWCPVIESETVGTHWSTGGSLWTSGNSSFSLLGWRSTGTGCPEWFWFLSLEIFESHMGKQYWVFLLKLELYQMDAESPSNPHPSVILWKAHNHYCLVLKHF